MRFEYWNPNKLNEHFEDVAIKRLVMAAEFIAKKARIKCPNKLNLSRPPYKTGKYAGRDWTARDAGQLKKSIRVVRKRTKSGKAFSRKRNVRVYIGNYRAYYAKIVEFNQPFLRPAFYTSMPEMKAIIGVR